MADPERKGIESSPHLSDKVVGRASEEHSKSPHHHKEETHGTSDDIDENTPTDEVKRPNVIQRAKEEVEALFGSIVHSNKDDK